MQNLTNCKISFDRLLLAIFAFCIYISSYGQPCPTPIQPTIFEEQCITFVLGINTLGTFTSPGVITPATCSSGISEYSLNGGAYTSTLPLYDPINPITIDAACNCGPATGSGASTISMTMPNNPCLTIPLNFMDPCNCADPLNCVDGTAQFNHDFLDLDFGLPEAAVTILSATPDFVAIPPCSSPTGAAVAHTFGNQFIETRVGTGIYRLEFWKLYNGRLPTVQVVIDPAGPANPFQLTIPTEIFVTHAVCDCLRGGGGTVTTGGGTGGTSGGETTGGTSGGGTGETTEEETGGGGIATIPTMSEWGLIIFGLLILNFGLFFIYQQEQVIMTSTDNSIVNNNTNPFDKTVTLKYFTFILIKLSIIFTIAIQIFGYELMSFDIPGSILTAGLLTYLIQLIRLVYRD